MLRSTYSLKIGISLLLLILLVFSTFAACSKKAVEYNVEKLFFGMPELIQQEIITVNLSDKDEYKVYKSLMEKGPIIPGIFQSAVPQGMAYYEEKDLLLISSYMFDSRPSCITAVSMTDGLLKKTLWLLNPDGTPHKGHAGGLSVSSKHLWLASGKGVYYVPLDSFNNLSDNNNLTLTAFVPTAVKGSFSTFYNGILWVGEFTSRDGSYTAPVTHHYRTEDGMVNHGWMAGFILDIETDLMNHDKIIEDVNYPDYIFSIPHEVQGAVFTDDKIYFSQSYGRKNNSRISVYSDPGAESSLSTFLFEEGVSVPVWILGKDNFVKEIIAPPMSEGIVKYKEAIAVLFESGSDKYRSSAKNPQDRIHYLSLELIKNHF